MPPHDDIAATQAAVSRYIKQVRRTRGWSQTKTAKVAGVSKTTIGRNENPPEDYTYVMSTTTLRRLAQGSGIKLPPELHDVDAGGMARGFAEPEVVEIFQEDAPPELEISSPDQTVWEVHGRGLEMLGYMPGDMVLVDRSVRASEGDAVCAQLVDDMRGTAETVFRVWRPPYLMTETWHQDAKKAPLPVNPDCIVGPVVRSLRVRKKSA